MTPPVDRTPLELSRLATTLRPEAEPRPPTTADEILAEALPVIAEELDEIRDHAINGHKAIIEGLGDLSAKLDHHIADSERRHEAILEAIHSLRRHPR